MSEFDLHQIFRRDRKDAARITHGKALEMPELTNCFARLSLYCCAG